MFIFLGITSCIDSSAIEQSNVSTDHVTNDIPNNNVTIGDNYNQIFYGEWEITSYIEGGRFSNPQEAKNFIGSSIKFMENAVIVDNTQVIKNPTYCCVLVDTKEQNYFWKYFFPNNPSDIIIQDSPYFAYIYIGNSLDIQESTTNDVLRYMNGFYIKDSETLIFDGSFGFLEMKRLSYPEGYESRIGGV